MAAPRVFTKYNQLTASPTLAFARTCRATSIGSVLPMSSVGTNTSANASAPVSAPPGVATL